MGGRRFDKEGGRSGPCFVLIILIVCLSLTTSRPISTSFQSRIRKVSGLPQPRSDGRHLIQFTDTQEGWLADNKNLWRTTDGGMSWKLVYSISQRSLNSIMGFQFVDSRKGFLRTSGWLLKTEDGGCTWRRLHTPFDFPQGQLLDLSFLAGGKVGWVVGGIYRPITRKELEQHPYPNYAIGTLPNDTEAVLEGAVFHTDDGGRTWHEQIRTRDVHIFLGLSFLDARHGVVLGDLGVFYTRDGGRSWHPIEFRDDCVDQNFMAVFEEHPVDVYFVGFGAGWVSYTGGYMAKSEDGGQTWCDLLHLGGTWPNSSDNFFQKIRFIDQKHGFGLDVDGALYETRDGGATWVKINANIRFEDIYLFDANHIWAVADEGLFRIVP